MMVSMQKTIDCKKLAFQTKEAIKNLGIDYGFEAANTGASSCNGFILERNTALIYASVAYLEYPNRAEVEFKFFNRMNILNKKNLKLLTEYAEGMQKLMDICEKAAVGNRISGGSGVWRSRIS